MQITLLTADEFVEPLAPAFKDWLRPTTARYRGVAERPIIRACDCGKSYLHIQGRPLVRCPRCHAQHVYEATPEQKRRHKLSSKFGLSLERYQELHDAQKGLCAICQRPERFKRMLAVDHCHRTGHVRGLLCGMCNTAIGKLDDSPELLERAIAYLRGHHASVGDREVGGVQ